MHFECGRRCSQLHYFFLSERQLGLDKLWCKKLGRQLTSEEILGTPEGVRIVAEWVPATGLFKWARSHGVEDDE